MSARAPLDEELRADMLAPPAITRDLSGLGGRLRARCEDFVVDEIPAYGPDGRGDRHLLVRLQKRDLSTPAAVDVVARACGLSRSDVGVAGRKDTLAVTRQWISVPAGAARALARLRHDDVEILEVHPHGQKLRRGHLRGNRFDVVVRDPVVGAEVALARVSAKLEALRERWGLDNVYGPQRFGRGGRNLEEGLRLLGTERLGRGRTFLASAGQSALFNAYAAERRRRGLHVRVLEGDVLRTRPRGGLFVCDDVARDQGRLEAAEVELTGPVFGARSMAPPPGSAAGALEAEILDRAGIDPRRLAAHGKRLPGSRRELRLPVGDLGLQVEPVPAGDGLGEGVRLRFVLPAGAFATQLTRELQCGPDTGDALDDPYED